MFSEKDLIESNRGGAGPAPELNVIEEVDGDGQLDLDDLIADDLEEDGSLSEEDDIASIGDQVDLDTLPVDSDAEDDEPLQG